MQTYEEKKERNEQDGRKKKTLKEGIKKKKREREREGRENVQIFGKEKTKEKRQRRLDDKKTCKFFNVGASKVKQKAGAVNITIDSKGFLASLFLLEARAYLEPAKKKSILTPRPSTIGYLHEHKYRSLSSVPTARIVPISFVTSS